MKSNHHRTPNTVFHIPVARRRLLKSMAVASAGFVLPGYLAEALTLSPGVTEGPYYPLADDIPLDKDNDLVRLDDRLTIAAGVVTHITGRVLDSNGGPIRQALVELWHADREGDYLYSAGVGRNSACDANFAGFGQFLTGSDGRFRFRTIKAGLYQGRARHYHWGVTIPGQTRRFSTQTGWSETARDLNGNVWGTQNANDGVFRGVTNAAQRASMLLDFAAVPGTTTGEEFAIWDFVSGLTPVEPVYPAGSLVVKGALVAVPGGGARYRLTFPVYAGYTYEVYGNPTFEALDWRALPFSMTAQGTLDRHKHSVTAEGSLDVFLTTAAERGYYYVAFRVPGANTGTPSGGGGRGGG